MVDIVNSELGKIPPGLINAEKKEVNLENSYMTPFEEAFLAGPKSIKIKDEEIFVNSRNILALMQDPDKRKVLFTPHCVTDKKENPEKATERRGQIGFLANLTLQNFFESERLDKYSFQNIKLYYKSGKPDDVGQLDEFEISFSKNGAIINLSEIADEDLVVSEDFKHVVNFLGKEGEVLKFKVKSEEEIKKEKEKKEAIRVLIVEDDPDIREILETVADSVGGYEFISTDNKAKALRILEESKTNGRPIGLVFSDLVLKDNLEDGLEIAKEAKVKQLADYFILFTSKAQKFEGMSEDQLGEMGINKVFQKTGVIEDLKKFFNDAKEKIKSARETKTEPAAKPQNT